ncbi:EthD domain-containing protein [Pseudomaricurvus sp. HS19]|uniref:EthD domain-containing protein n=1 Tax=Pseudomaricurvus sp. HS19 TaxID=2692626 RepID=UPI00136C8CFB|nr:EthD domain-containing protein [Pseudomaricurvus sp. HS19]MYM63993.1 EthD family reductase [Pseudomaricurvus sp. HS19]
MACYKILLFMKRRADLSAEAFRDYYENHHAPLCQKYSRGVARYLRRFIEPQVHPETGVWEDPPFDVITELWFDNEEVYKGALAYLTSSVMPDEIIADEKNLFDRSSFRIATVVEHE